MKRSHSTLLIILLVGAIGLFNFHCATPEMTSARLYVQQEQWVEAQSALETELENNPENSEAWYMLGRVHSELGDFDKMLEAFDQSLEHSNDYQEEISEIRFNNWVNFINAGIDEYNYGQEDPDYYRSAIEYFKLAAKMEPDSTVAYKNWGFAHLILGEMDQAIEPFEETLKREDDPEIAKYTGQIYFDKGYDIWSRHRAEDMDPALRQEMEENLEESIRYLTKSMEWDPDDGEVVATLSNAFIVLEREEEAKEIFRQGIETDPDNKIYYYNLGVLELEDDNFEHAIDLFESAIELDPEYDDAYYNLGVAYVNWGVELRERAVEAGDEDKEYREKFEAAVPHLERVVDARPNDPELFETLGRLYANIDRVADAEAAFERADQLRGGE